MKKGSLKYENCTSCKGTYNLLDGACLDNCPDGYISINLKCEKCK